MSTYQVPVTPADYVDRPRLATLLAAETRLVVVVAPAGWGKSTAVAGWLASWLAGGLAAGRPSAGSAAWADASTAADDPVRLCDLLASASQALHPAAGMASAAFQSTGAAPTPLERLDALLGELIAVGAAGVLVLDEAHTVTGPGAALVLQRFIERLPSTLRVVLIGRSEPPLPLARFRARGWVTDVRDDALRFSSDEADALLHRRPGRRLTPPQLRVLMDRSRGWAAALRLAQALLAGITDARQADLVLARFAGTTREVADYLADEILDRLDPALRDFLLEVSVLPVLSREACVAVTGRSDAVAMLDALRRAHLLLHDDAAADRPRLHPLFAELLRARLAATAEGAVPALCRAAAWAVAAGADEEAVELWLDARAWDDAVAAIARIVPTLVARGDAGRLAAWLDRLPATIVDSSAPCCVGRAWASFVAGDASAVDWSLDAAERVADGDPIALGAAAAVRAYVALRQHDMPGVARFGAAALERLGAQEPALRAALLSQMATARLVLGDGDAARRLLDAGLALGRGRARQPWEELGSAGMVVPMTYAAWQCWQTGNLTEARHLYGSALTLAAAGAPTPLPGAAVAHSGLADIAYELDDLDAADRHVERALDLGARERSAEARVTAYFTAARLRLARGDAPGACAAAAAALREGHYLGSLLGYIEALSAECRARAGEIDAALAWVRRLPPDGGGGDEFRIIRTARCLAAARILLLADRATEATAWVARFDGDGDGVVDAGGAFTVAMTATSAAVHAATGDEPQAYEAARRAARCAPRHGHLRSIVDAGPRIAPLIGRLYRDAAGGDAALDREHLARLRDALARQRAVDAPPPTMSAQRPGVRLTAREVQVLRLVADGLRNHEIAERLGSSPATVKKQLLSVFLKLDASSRTHAVVRARELELLR